MWQLPPYRGGPCVDQDRRTVAAATSRVDYVPDSSTTAAFTADVPISIPMYMGQALPAVTGWHAFQRGNESNCPSSTHKYFCFAISVALSFYA